MAIYFREPQQDPLWGSLGQVLGGLGGLGIGYGLNQLGGFGQDQVKSLKTFGFSDEEAKAISKFPPASQAQIIKEKMRQQEGMRQSDLYGQIVGGGGGNIQSPGSPSSISMEQTPMGGLGGSQMQQMPQTGIEALQGLADPGQSLLAELERRRDAVLRTPFSPQMKKDAVSAIDKQIDTLIKKESIERKQQMEEKKLSFAEQKETNKETKKFFDDTKTKAKDARENDVRLDRMEELAKSGRLTGPGTYKFMEKLGIPLDPNSAEFEKLTTDFLKNLKSIFGGRISNAEMQTYLKSLPSLSLSNPGRFRLINNLKIMNAGAKAENEAMKQIIKENGGKRPANLEDLVEEKVKPIKDRLAQEFKLGVRTEIPEETYLEQAERIGVPVATKVGQAALPLLGMAVGGIPGAAIGGLGSVLLGGGVGNILSGLGREE